MNKLVFTLGLFLGFSVYAVAQIAPAFVYQTPDSLKRLNYVSAAQIAGVVDLDAKGFKRYVLDMHIQKLTLYNEDYSVFETVKFDFPIDDYGIFIDNLEMIHISTNTFDKDAGIEFLFHLQFQGKSWTEEVVMESLSGSLVSAQNSAMRTVTVARYDRNEGRDQRNTRNVLVDDNGKILLNKVGKYTNKKPALKTTDNGVLLVIPTSNSSIEMYEFSGKGTRKKKQIDEGAPTFQGENLDVGTRITLDKIMFDQSSAELTNTSHEELNQLTLLMKDNPSLVILLEGHTDNQGSAKSNLKLSEDRVTAIRDFLINNGIRAKRVKTKAFGQTKPIARNDTEESRRLNRRVEMVVIEN